MPTIYPGLSIGAAARLAIFKREASDPRRHWVRPMTWRDVRFAKLTSHSGLAQGSNDGRPVWYSDDERPQFRGEKPVTDISRRFGGYYTDPDCTDDAVGIIARLPHGRYLAGYLWSGNGERVYFPDIWNDEEMAADVADGHARVFAERETEYQTRWHEARQLADQIESAEHRLLECLALRNRECFRALRDEARELIGKIRDNRETLARDFADVGL